MLIVVWVLVDGVLASEVRQTLMLGVRAVLPHRRIVLISHMV